MKVGDKSLQMGRGIRDGEARERRVREFKKLRYYVPVPTCTSTNKYSTHVYVLRVSMESAPGLHN